ncbi:kinetochore protein Spc25-like isoform X1 [Amblyomma americanum]
MAVNERPAKILAQFVPKTREIAQQFKTELLQRQLFVRKLLKDAEVHALDRRKFDEGLEDGLRNIAVLSQREQELTERYKADHERSSALADVTSRKRERLELHTLNLHLYSQLQMVPAELKQSLDLLAKWAGLQLIPVPGHGYRLCLTLLDRQQPHRCCSLLLGRDSEGNYEASECEPALDSLDGLLVELNQTRNLSRFVKLLRQQFRSLLLAGSTG